MSSRSLNKVQLIGNLTRDPELRYTSNGTPVCTLGLATNRNWSDSNNQKQEETEFHRIVAWSKLAELCNQLLFKGRKIFVEGRLQTRRWTSSEGDERQTTEIVIDDMIILDSRRRDDEHRSRDGEHTNISEDMRTGTDIDTEKSAKKIVVVRSTPKKVEKKKQETEKKEEVIESDEISVDDIAI